MTTATKYGINWVRAGWASLLENINVLFLANPQVQIDG